MDCSKVTIDNISEYVVKNIRYLSCIDLDKINKELMFKLFEINLNVYSYFKPYLTAKQLEELIEKFPFLIEKVYMPNFSLIKKAVKSEPNVLSVVFDNKYIKLTDDELFDLLKSDVRLLKFVPKKFQNENLVKRLCHIDIEAYKYSNYYIEEIEDYIVENYPDKYYLLKKMKDEYYIKLVYYNQSFFFNLLDKNLIDELDYEKLFERFPRTLRYIYNKIDKKYWIYAIKNDLSLLNFVPYDEKLIRKILKYNGKVIKYLKNKTVEDIIMAIDSNVLSLDYIEKKRKVYIDYAYKIDSIAIKYKNIREMSEDELFNAVKRNYNAIKYIPKDLQNEKMQIEAILDSNGEIINYITPVNNNVVMYILKFVPTYILSIKNPTTEMFLLAFSEQPSLILQYNDFENVFDTEILKTVIFNDPSLIQYFNDPTKELMLIAVSQDPFVLKYLNYQDYDIVKTALSVNPKAIKYVDKSLLTEDLIKMVYQLDPDVFKFIENDID